jgi:F0F1-type ATP synthase delta subunit
MALDKPVAHQRRIELPTIVFGPVEVHRLQRELESLDDFMQQASIRQPGKQAAAPRTSRSLEALAGNNGLNLLQSTDRKKLQQFLQSVETKAPVIHMSLAADPSAAFTAKIVAWLRTNVHPYALLQLGLQPTIAAGCILRTPNKVFDFSLRHRFTEQRQVLLDALNRQPEEQSVAESAKQEPAA